MPGINFYTADKGYNLKEKNRIKKWILSEVSSYGKEIEEINIILCSDDYLLELNKKFLNHFDLTDVITFDNSSKKRVSGEIYISIDRIRENAKKFKVKVFDEYLRIIIHGTLHLLNFTDKTVEERRQMSLKETEAIIRFKEL